MRCFIADAGGSFAYLSHSAQNWLIPASERPVPESAERFSLAGTHQWFIFAERRTEQSARHFSAAANWINFFDANLICNLRDTQQREWLFITPRLCAAARLMECLQFLFEQGATWKWNNEGYTANLLYKFVVIVTRLKIVSCWSN